MSTQVDAKIANLEDMPVIEVAERPGVGLDGQPRPTEDVVITLPNAVILLDGATSLRPELLPGGWYAHRLAGELAGRLTGYPDADLADLLAASIKVVARNHGLEPGESPSSTVALLRWNDRVVEGLVLADSPIVAFTPEPQVLADSRMGRLPRGAYRDRLSAGEGFGEDHLVALRSSADRVGRLRNQEGGFWVAEAEPDAAYYAERATWPRSEVRAALLASDGVSCGVDDYGIFADWSAVLELARREDVEAVLDAVREAETSDPQGTRWPRSKPHDDQALAVVTFD